MILALASAVLAATPVAAPADPTAAAMAKLAPAFRGTIISTYPDGGTGRAVLPSRLEPPRLRVWSCG